MARVTITQDNMERSKIIPPGKYIVLVSNATEETAGTDGSSLFVYELKVDEGVNKGVAMRYQVSEKAEGMGYEFWEACGFEIKPGVVLDPTSFKGKRCGCFVQRGEYKGRPQNQPVSFYRLTSDPVAQAGSAPIGMEKRS